MPSSKARSSRTHCRGQGQGRLAVHPATAGERTTTTGTETRRRRENQHGRRQVPQDPLQDVRRWHLALASYTAAWAECSGDKRSGRTILEAHAPQASSAGNANCPHPPRRVSSPGINAVRVTPRRRLPLVEKSRWPATVDLRKIAVGRTPVQVSRLNPELRRGRRGTRHRRTEVPRHRRDGDGEAAETARRISSPQHHREEGERCEHLQEAQVSRRISPKRLPSARRRSRAASSDHPARDHAPRRPTQTPCRSPNAIRDVSWRARGRRVRSARRQGAIASREARRFLLAKLYRTTVRR